MAKLRAAIALLFLVFAGTPSLAQTYPDRPIHLIVPFAAGGLVDVLARMLGEELSKAFAQPIIIENRPGAGGNVGADAVAKAAPDGYTLLMTSAGIQSINQFLYKSMPFDPEKAFAPVSLVADMPMLVLVRSSTEIKSLQDLIANAKANPGKLNFGSAGIGTTGHLGQALLAHAAGITLSHVPYRGAGPAVNDLVAGHIQGTVDNPPLVLPHIKAGTLTALAVASPRRLPVLPDVPTAAEAGLPSWEVSSWFGVAAPAGTPPAIIRRLQSEIAQALLKSTVRQLFAESGMQGSGNTSEEFGRFIRDERAKWAEVVRIAGIQPN